jgi:AAA ATPase domain
MDDISVRHSARETRLAGAPPFGLIKGKFLRPWVRPGTIRRPRLIERLARSDSRPIVSVVAPAGYGKTTLLAQWPERDGQAIAWVSVDQADNDPKVLLTYIAEALNAVEPVGKRVFDALASPANSVPGSVVPRLCSAFSSMISPVVLILDDVHLLHSSACRAALSVLADHVPAGSQLVLAGRTEPPLRIARLRAEGRLAEIGPGDLSFTVREAASLLRAAEVVLDDDDAAELHQRTEGWPVGLAASSRSQAVAQARQLGLLEGLSGTFHPAAGDAAAACPGVRWSYHEGGRPWHPTTRFRATFRATGQVTAGSREPAACRSRFATLRTGSERSVRPRSLT